MVVSDLDLDDQPLRYRLGFAAIGNGQALRALSLVPGTCQALAT